MCAGIFGYVCTAHGENKPDNTDNKTKIHNGETAHTTEDIELTLREVGSLISASPAKTGKARNIKVQNRTARLILLLKVIYALLKYSV